MLGYFSRELLVGLWGPTRSMPGLGNALITLRFLIDPRLARLLQACLARAQSPQLTPWAAVLHLLALTGCADARRNPQEQIAFERTWTVARQIEAQSLDY
jgi:hypothetical protein